MKQRKYTKEFKLEAVALSEEDDVTVVQAARDLGISPKILYRWRAEQRDAEGEAFSGKGKLRATDEETRRLRRELDQVRMERDILKKALRVFARPESGNIGS
jgi:transposase